MSYGDGAGWNADTGRDSAEEQLEWLHLQTELLQDIRKHTRLMYIALIFWLVLTGLGALSWFLALLVAAAA